LVQSSRGMPLFKPFIDTDTGPLYKVPVTYYDPTHPQAREFVFEQSRKELPRLRHQGLLAGFLASPRCARCTPS